MGTYQQLVKKKCIENNWQYEDLPTLGLGLCEEAGEVAGAINNLNPLYKAKENRKYQDLEKELHDVLTYLCAIANRMNIELGI